MDWLGHASSVVKYQDILYVLHQDILYVWVSDRSSLLRESGGVEKPFLAFGSWEGFCVRGSQGRSPRDRTVESRFNSLH